MNECFLYVKHLSLFFGACTNYIVTWLLGIHVTWRSQRRSWIPNVSLQAVEEENHRDVEEAIEINPQVSQLVVDQSERLRKIKGNEKIYVDKAFNDNGVMKVEVVTALENRWLTDISPVFSRIVLNLEDELCPSVFVKDVLERSCWSQCYAKKDVSLDESGTKSRESGSRVESRIP